MKALKAVHLVMLLVLAGVRAAAADEVIVPAQEEPRHRPKLQNQIVRILDVEIPAGDATVYHAHALDYAFVMVNGVNIRNQIPGKDPVAVTIKGGDVGYYRTRTQGTYTHRFTNVDDHAFRAIGIELLQPPSMMSDVVAPLSLKTGYQTVLDNERVRAYRLVLEPGQKTPQVTLAKPSIRVVIAGGELAETANGAQLTSTLTPAQFQFRAEATQIELQNAGTSRIEIIEFELK